MLDIIVDKNEVLRYLGYTKNMHLSKEIDKQIDELIIKVLSVAESRVTYLCNLDIEKKDSLTVAGIKFLGNDIKKHLEKSSKAVFVAVTLGNQIDLLIRREEMLDISKAVIIDAICNTLVEQVADNVENEIRDSLAKKGLYLTGRFSPGYGDFPLEVEREILQKLDAERRVGITLTSTNLMLPKKSITAVLGSGNVQFAGRKAGCSSCLLRSKCEFRKRGTTCYE